MEVVSNDLMRDHHWKLVDSDALFLEWRDLHFTRFYFKYAADGFDLQLFRPRRSALRLMPPSPAASRFGRSGEIPWTRRSVPSICRFCLFVYCDLERGVLPALGVGLMPTPG